MRTSGAPKSPTAAVEAYRSAGTHMTVARPEDPIPCTLLYLTQQSHWHRTDTIPLDTTYLPHPQIQHAFLYVTESDITITTITVIIIFFIPTREQQQKHRQLTIQQTYNQRHNTHLVFLPFVTKFFFYHICDLYPRRAHPDFSAQDPRDHVPIG